MAPIINFDTLTDREILLLNITEIRDLKEKIVGRNGEGGLCAEVKKQDSRLRKLENWRWYIGGGLTLITFLLIGRYIVLPGHLP